MSISPESLFFDFQNVLLQDIEQILKFGWDYSSDINQDLVDYGVVEGLDIEISSTNSLEIKVTSGYGYNRKGVLLERTIGDVLTGGGFALESYALNIINYVHLRSLEVDDTSKLQSDTSKTFNTRKRYATNVIVSTSKPLYPDILLGYVKAKGNNVPLNSSRIVNTPPDRDVVHIKKKGSTAQTRNNPHGISPSDMSDFSSNVVNHINDRHSNVSIFDSESALKVAIQVGASGGAYYLSINDLNSDGIMFIDGKKIVRGNLDFSLIDNQITWTGEGTNNGTYYIYIDSSNLKVKKQIGAVPSGLIYTVDRNSAGVLSTLVDRRIFSSITTKNIRHKLTSLPSLFQGIGSDGKAGFSQQDINKQLYDYTLTLIKTLTTATPNNEGKIFFESGNGLNVKKSSSNPNAIEISNEALGFSLEMLRIDNATSGTGPIIITNVNNTRLGVIFCIIGSGFTNARFTWDQNDYYPRPAAANILATTMQVDAGLVPNLMPLGTAIQPFPLSVGFVLFSKDGGQLLLNKTACYVSYLNTLHIGNGVQTASTPVFSYPFLFGDSDYADASSSARIGEVRAHPSLSEGSFGYAVAAQFNSITGNIDSIISSPGFTNFSENTTVRFFILKSLGGV